MNRKPDPIIDAIEDEIDRTLQSFGYELVQLKLTGRRGSRTLTLLMDKPGGVTLGDCQYMASRLSVLLDARDPIEGHYTLLVSSPGVDRPLTREADFERFAGEKASVRSSDLTGNRMTRAGIIKGVVDGEVRLEVDGEDVTVPLADIESANLIYDWEKDPFTHTDS